MKKPFANKLAAINARSLDCVSGGLALATLSAVRALQGGGLASPVTPFGASLGAPAGLPLGGLPLGGLPLGGLAFEPDLVPFSAQARGVLNATQPPIALNEMTATIADDLAERTQGAVVFRSNGDGALTGADFLRAFNVNEAAAARAVGNILSQVRGSQQAALAQANPFQLASNALTGLTGLFRPQGSVPQQRFSPATGNIFNPGGGNTGGNAITNAITDVNRIAGGGAAAVPNGAASIVSPYVRNGGSEVAVGARLPTPDDRSVLPFGTGAQPIPYLNQYTSAFPATPGVFNVDPGLANRGAASGIPYLNQYTSAFPATPGVFNVDPGLANRGAATPSGFEGSTMTGFDPPGFTQGGGAASGIPYLNQYTSAFPATPGVFNVDPGLANRGAATPSGFEGSTMTGFDPPGFTQGGGAASGTFSTQAPYFSQYPNAFPSTGPGGFNVDPGLANRGFAATPGSETGPSGFEGSTMTGFEPPTFTQGGGTASDQFGTGAQPIPYTSGLPSTGSGSFNERWGEFPANGNGAQSNQYLNGGTPPATGGTFNGYDGEAAPVEPVVPRGPTALAENEYVDYGSDVA